jgi:hypothetical protein
MQKLIKNRGINLPKNFHFRGKNCDIFIVLRKQNPKVRKRRSIFFSTPFVQSTWKTGLKKDRTPFSHLWVLLTEYYVKITILVSKMEVFDQNYFFHLINYCMMNSGIFVLFVGILVLIPYLIPRFVTFTQKSEFLCDMIFSTFFTLVRFTWLKVITAVVQLSLSVQIYEQQWLPRRTLWSNVFVTLIGIPNVKRTITTIIYTVYINYVQTMLIHVESC